jgi:hypothetical protein
MSDPETSRNSTPLAGAGRQRVLDQIEVWRNELINLARSNRLLYFRHTKSSTLEIVREPERCREVVEAILAGRPWHFHEPPELDSRRDEEVDEDGRTDSEFEVLFVDQAPDVPAPDELITNKTEARTLRNALRLLDRRSMQEFMDKGIWILYLAAGVLRWVDPDTEEEAESPLMLIPVELHRENPREPYELRRADEDVVMNPALAVRLADFGIELPTVDEEEFDLDAVLAEVDELVAGHPTWEVQRRLLISPFSFHKEVMYRDLLKNAEEVADHSLVQALALGSVEGSVVDFDPVPEERLDQDAPPEDVITILDADATQRQCIAAAADGRSFVLDGPPGTGKSQTITNVIAELVANGKTVLFVSEKAAALEVVHKRLRAAGLGDYALELHSHKATRKEVAQQLGASLAYHPTVPPSMAQTAQSKLRRREELSERARAMNDVRQPLGRSLHQVIGRIAQLQELPQAAPPELGAELKADELAQILTAAGEISRAWGPVARGDDFLWRDLKDVRLDASRRQRTAEQVAEAASELRAVVVASSDAAGALLRAAPRDFGEAELLVRLVRHIEGREGVPSVWLTMASLSPVEERLQERCDDSSRHVGCVKALEQGVGARWQDIDVAVSDGLSHALEDLGRLPLPYALPQETAAAELRALHEFVQSSSLVLAEARDDAELISGAFGMPSAGLSPRRAIELIDLALLAADAARPEPEWVNPATIESVEQAANTLQPLCDSFAGKRDQLGSVFTDDVLALDLEGLCQRFATVHKGLGRLKGSYRQDKKTIAAAARTGKADKSAIERLPRALEWQKLTCEL